MSVSHKEEFQL